MHDKAFKYVFKNKDNFNILVEHCLKINETFTEITSKEFSNGKIKTDPICKK